MYLEKVSAAVQSLPTRLLLPRNVDSENNTPMPSITAPLPIIKVIQNGARWEIHWDYQGARLWHESGCREVGAPELFILGIPTGLPINLAR